MAWHANGGRPQRPRIAVDCEDSSRGRGLLAVSALHIAAPALRDFELAATNAADPVVQAAIEALVWETGLSVTSSEDLPDRALERAVLFVAIAVRDTGHLPLARLSGRGIACLVPVQFPRGSEAFGTSVLQRAAHDPGALADHILEVVGK